MACPLVDVDAVFESPPRTSSQATKATAIATAITAPARTFGLRAQGLVRRSFIATKHRFSPGGQGPAAIANRPELRVSEAKSNQLSGTSSRAPSALPLHWPNEVDCDRPGSRSRLGAGVGRVRLRAQH